METNREAKLNAISAVREQVFNAVPVGEANAMTARQIWREVDCWSEIGVRNQLAVLANEDRVKREKQNLSAVSQFQWLYWKELPAPPATDATGVFKV